MINSMGTKIMKAITKAIAITLRRNPKNVRKMHDFLFLVCLAMQLTYLCGSTLQYLMAWVQTTKCLTSTIGTKKGYP